MQQPHIFPKLRKRVLELLAGYVQSANILEKIDEFIVPPGLGKYSGVLGAIALAEELSSGPSGNRRFVM